MLLEEICMRNASGISLTKSETGESLLDKEIFYNFFKPSTITSCDRLVHALNLYGVKYEIFRRIGSDRKVSHTLSLNIIRA